MISLCPARYSLTSLKCIDALDNQSLIRAVTSYFKLNLLMI